MHRHNRAALDLRQQRHFLRQQLPQGILDDRARFALGEFAKRTHLLVEQRVVRDIGPAHSGRSVTVAGVNRARYFDFTMRTVITHHRIQRGVIDLAFFQFVNIVGGITGLMRGPVAITETMQRVGGGIDFAKNSPHRCRRCHLLDQQSVEIRIRVFAKIQDAGDRRTDLSLLRSHVLLAYCIDLVAGVVMGDHRVAVGRTFLPQHSGYIQAIGCGAFQYFRGAKSAGRENDIGGAENYRVCLLRP